MANVVPPEVANELTFRFTSAYLSIISAFSSHEEPVKGTMHSCLLRKIERIESRHHTMDTWAAKEPDGVGKCTKHSLMFYPSFLRPIHSKHHGVVLQHHTEVIPGLKLPRKTSNRLSFVALRWAAFGNYLHNSFYLSFISYHSKHLYLCD